MRRARVSRDGREALTMLAFSFGLTCACAWADATFGNHGPNVPPEDSFTAINGSDSQRAAARPRARDMDAAAASPP